MCSRGGHNLFQNCEVYMASPGIVIKVDPHFLLHSTYQLLVIAFHCCLNTNFFDFPKIKQNALILFQD